MSINIPLVVETWHRERDLLLRDYPELADDPETLNDTLEGITGARDVVWLLVKKSREDQAACDALGRLISDYQDRQSRYDRRAQSARAAALRMMQTMGENKLERPEATILRSSSPAKILIPDGAAVPDAYCVVKRLPNLTMIGALLRNNPNPPNWATLSEPGEHLTVRVR